mgnify:CR=1 FL=1
MFTAMKKAQSTMEFLTTYGLAFFIILIAIGGLNYFDLLNAKSFVPNSCKLDGAIECPVYAITPTSETDINLDLRLKNNLAERVNITGVRIKEKKMDEFCKSTEIWDVNGASVQHDNVLPHTREADIRFKLDDGSDCPFASSGLNDIEGKKKRFDVQVYYTKGDSDKVAVAIGVMTVSIK